MPAAGLNAEGLLGIYAPQDYSGGGADGFAGAVGAAINAGGGTVLLSDWRLFNGDLVVPSTVGLKVLPGGVLAGNHTLTARGPLDLPAAQWLYGGANLVVGAGQLDDYRPEWWGVTGTGDQVPVNGAITAASASGGGTVRLQPKQYNCGAPVVGAPRVALRGHYTDPSGNQATVFNGTSASIDVVQIPHPGSFLFEGVLISGTFRNGMHLVSPTGANQYVTFVTLLDIRVVAPQNGGACLLTEGSVEELRMYRLKLDAGAGSTKGWHHQYLGGSPIYIDKSCLVDSQISGGDNAIHLEVATSESLYLVNVTLNVTNHSGMILDGGFGDLNIVGLNTEGLCQHGGTAATTGSMSSGSNQLNVASASGFANGDTVTVGGALSTYPGTLITTIVAGAGTTTLTLAAPATQTVTNAPVYNSVDDEIVLTSTHGGGGPARINLVGLAMGGSGGQGHVRFSLNAAGGSAIEVVNGSYANPIYDPGGQVNGIIQSGTIWRRPVKTMVFGQQSLPWDAPLGTNAAILSSPKGGDFIIGLTDSNGDGTGGGFGAYRFYKGTPNRDQLAVLDNDGTWYPAKISSLNTGVLTPNSPTPDVSGLGWQWRTQNTAPTSVTNFVNGNGTLIAVLCQDNFTTFVNGSTLSTRTGANFSAVNGQIYLFIYLQGQWRMV